MVVGVVLEQVELVAKPPVLGAKKIAPLQKDPKQQELRHTWCRQSECHTHMHRTDADTNTDTGTDRDTSTGTDTGTDTGADTQKGTEAGTDT